MPISRLFINAGPRLFVPPWFSIRRTIPSRGRKFIKNRYSFRGGDLLAFQTVHICRLLRHRALCSCIRSVDIRIHAYAKAFNPEWRVTILKYRLANVCGVCTLSYVQGLHLKGTTYASHRIQVDRLWAILIRDQFMLVRQRLTDRNTSNRFLSNSLVSLSRYHLFAFQNFPLYNLHITYSSIGSKTTNWKKNIIRY